MKKIIFMCMLSLPFVGAAEDHRESHGNREDERRCFREIRNLGCGKPESHDAFVACVDRKADKLSPNCRSFHAEEVQRLKQHSH
jgi:hypothetical protein